MLLSLVLLRHQLKVKLAGLTPRAKLEAVSASAS
jgi:hypothetical protein